MPTMPEALAGFVRSRWFRHLGESRSKNPLSFRSESLMPAFIEVNLAGRGPGENRRVDSMDSVLGRGGECDG